MVSHNHNTFRCPVCGNEHLIGEILPGATLPTAIANTIHDRHAAWSADDDVCVDCFNRAVVDHIEDTLKDEKGEPLSNMETDVINSIKRQALIPADIEFERALTRGDRLANRIADTVGTWSFVALILVGMVIWVVANVVWRPFEPYPLIILIGMGTVLGALAAVQAPIILMAQRRNHKLDRMRDENDARINLKAELEIRYLSEKIDHLLLHNRNTLIEIRAMQDELLRAIEADDESRVRPEA
ncbi:MAG: DUF1003 domain-containing protein [Chloroflexi bacterium]|nr:MAG: DUF1003 domain-containing protein [Chloroflexota bacterium]